MKWLKRARQVLESYFLGSGSPSMTQGHSALRVGLVAPFWTIRILIGRVLAEK